MDSRGGETVVIGRLARELPLQHHLCAPREGEMVKEAGYAGCLVESELPQSRKSNPFPRRSGERLGQIREANLDEFQGRGSFEEGCQVLNRYGGSRGEFEPCEAGEVETTKVRAEVV